MKAGPEYWLTEEQALHVCMPSKTENAPQDVSARIVPRGAAMGMQQTDSLTETQQVQLDFEAQALAQIRTDPTISLQDARELVLARLAEQEQRKLGSDVAAAKKAAAALERQRREQERAATEAARQAEIARAREAAARAQAEAERQARVDGWEGRIVAAEREYEAAVAELSSSFGALLDSAVAVLQKQQAAWATARESGEYGRAPRLDGRVGDCLLAIVRERRIADTLSYDQLRATRGWLERAGESQ